MASQKITQYPALTAPASADVLPIIDVSEALPENQNKKITYSELLASAPSGTAAAPAFSFDSDPNTGIYNSGADQLALSTGGTGRLFVDSNGRVNIAGTTGATLKVGDATAPAAIDGTGAAYTPQIYNTQTGGIAGIGVYTNDGVNNRRTSFFVDQTNSLWGLSLNWSSSGPAPFVIRDAVSEKLRIDTQGRLLVGTSSDSGGALLQVNGDRIRVGTAKTPASATAAGTAGEICWDANYIYVCTATNTWKRTALTTW